jgi:hypothetical protein
MAQNELHSFCFPLIFKNGIMMLESAMRTVPALMKTGTLKLVYFSNVYSIISCGIILGGKLTGSKKVFYIQKRVIRMMAGAKRRAYCRELFKKFNILSVTSEVLLSSLSFVVDSMERFETHISQKYKI